ncbi:MAG: hypothetical protein ACR2IV_01940 [Bryobacteraceae bacterium]
MNRNLKITTFVLFLSLGLIFCAVKGLRLAADQIDDAQKQLSSVDAMIRHAQKQIREGRQTFRYDTFGDQDYWGNTLKLHQATAGAKLGGVGPGVSPTTALAVGLKVDVDALPSPSFSN